MSTPSLRNVVFDFGGVLIRWQPEELIAACAPDVAARNALRTALFQHPDWIEMDRGTLDENEAAQRCAARLSSSVAEVRDAQAVPLYGLSNMSAPNFRSLPDRYPALWRRFRGIVVSGEIGLIKPDPRIFEHLCHAYGLDPRSSVFIDDYAPNVECARRLGFEAILFTTPQACASALARAGVPLPRASETRSFDTGAVPDT